MSGRELGANSTNPGSLSELMINAASFLAPSYNIQDKWNAALLLAHENMAAIYY